MLEELEKYEKIFLSREDEDAIIPICFDKLFKKVFANKNYLKPLEELLSICLDIDLNDIRGNISLTGNEPIVENKNSKKRVLDIITEVVLPNKKRNVINIEMNLSSGSIKRNIGYETKLYSNEIRAGESYEDMPDVIQICFDYFNVNKQNPMVEKIYYLKDQTGHILDSGLEIRHVDIEKSKELWYADNISNQKENQKLIKLGALITMNRKADFKKCLEDLGLEEDTKKYIEEVAMDYSKDDKSWLAVDEEMERLALKKTEISIAKKEGLQEGIEQGIEQSKIEIAKNMLKKNLSLELISDTTGLSIEKIKKLNEEN